MASSHVAPTSHLIASGKGKRDFRYLNGGPRISELGHVSGTSPSSSTSAQSSSSTAAAGGSSGERRNKRAKVAAACLYCKRSHMACQDTRPCSRCVARGIGPLCLEDDAMSNNHNNNNTMRSGTVLPRRQSLTQGRSMNSGTNHNRPDRESEEAIQMNLATFLAAFEGGAPDHFPPIDLQPNWIDLPLRPEQTVGARLSESLGTEATSLISPGDSSGARGEATAVTRAAVPHGALIPERLADHSGPKGKRRRRPWDHILNACYIAEDSTVRPYQYAYGYARLQRWTRSPNSGWSTGAIERVHALVQDQIRPFLRARWGKLSDLQLVEEEQKFLSLVDHIRSHVSEAVQVPLVVLRRTWEIICANEAWAALCQMDVSCFDSGRLCLYQLLTESLAVEMFEKYADFVLRGSPSPLRSNGFVEFSRQKASGVDIIHVKEAVHVSMEPILDNHGLPICHIATFSVVS